MRNPFSGLWASILRLLNLQPYYPKSLAENLLLNHRDDTIALLDAILKNGDHIRSLKAISTNLMTEMIRSRDVSWISKMSLINSGRLSDEAFELACEDPSLADKVALCQHAPPVLLAKLARSDDWLVKDHVARNPSCPRETAVDLSRDESWLVRESLANNTPYIDLLRMLASDSAAAVRSGVAKNTACPLETRHHLSLDPNKVVRGLADRSLPHEWVPYVQGEMKEAVDA
jgi:hypothetical protein